MTQQLEESQKPRAMISTYTVDTRLPSCKVTAKVLQELEDYLRRLTRELAETENQEVKVVITDSLGEETLTSIKEFDQSVFPNDTESVELKCSASGRSMPVDISVKFHRTKLYSRLQISYGGISSREKVVGLLRGIVRRLGSSKTYHFMYHNLIYDISLTLAATGSLMFLVNTFRGEPHHGILRPVALLSAVICAVALRFMKPYTTFDTARNAWLGTMTKFVFGGFIGFLIVTALTLIRRDFLGF
jgi:hypothetical protein